MAHIPTNNDIYGSKDGNQAIDDCTPRKKTVVAGDSRAHQEATALPEASSETNRRYSGKKLVVSAVQKAQTASEPHLEVSRARTSSDDAIGSHRDPAKRDDVERLVSTFPSNDEPSASTVAVAHERGDQKPDYLRSLEPDTRPAATISAGVQPAGSTLIDLRRSPSPGQLYRDKRTGVFIGLPPYFQPSPDLRSRWETQILPQLQVDVEEYQDKQSRTKDGLRYVPWLNVELRMSGRMKKHQVTLVPTVWFLYDSFRWREATREFVKGLGYLSGEGLGPSEVHKGFPKSSALQVPVEDLQVSNASSIDLSQGEKLCVHVETPKSRVACGLLCCATFLQHGIPRTQYVSRIGGLVKVNARTLALTTSHGFLQELISMGDDGDSDFETDSGDESEFDDEQLLDVYVSERGEINSDPLNKSSHVQSISAEDIQETGLKISQRRIGGIDSEILKRISWFQLSPEAIQETCFFGLDGLELAEIFHHSMPLYPEEIRISRRKGFAASSPRERAGVPRTGDFSLLRLPGSDGLQNSHNSTDDGISGPVVLHGIAKPEDIDPGHVHLLLRPESVVQATLLPDTILFSPYGVSVRAHRLLLDHPLASGCSGTWVVQKERFCGMIIAAYDEEPFAVMLSSYQVAHDILSVFPNISNIKLPGGEDSRSTVRPTEKKDEPSTTKPPGQGDVFHLDALDQSVNFKCIIRSVYENEPDQEESLVSHNETVKVKSLIVYIRNKYNIPGLISIHRSEKDQKTGNLVPGPEIIVFRTLKENETIFALYDDRLAVVAGGFGGGPSSGKEPGIAERGTGKGARIDTEDHVQGGYKVGPTVRGGKLFGIRDAFTDVDPFIYDTAATGGKGASGKRMEEEYPAVDE